MTGVTAPSGITDGLTLRYISRGPARSLSVMVASPAATAMDGEAPTMRTVSSTSAVVSSAGVRVKEAVAEELPAGTTIWN